MQKTTTLERILTGLLYGLPVVFLVICYFLIITAGEDIFQGAATAPNVIGDGIAAFWHSARLADMYAWAVINFFDYSYSFGVDTIFRLVDVLIAMAIFVMTTNIALGRRPKFQLTDAAVFASCFLMVFLTSNGATLYAGFSKIHNYLLIAWFSLVFILPYLREIRGEQLKNTWWRVIMMMILGFLFGWGTNLTAIVFLLCLPAYALYLQIKKQPVKVKRFLGSWMGAGVLGVILGLAVVYLFGPGVSDYENNPVYLSVSDYLPFGEIFTNFGSSVGRIILHNLFNFGRFLLPFGVILAIVAGYGLILKRKKQWTWPKFSQKEQNYLVAIALFGFLHILAMSQIYYYTRMVLPAYLVMVGGMIYLIRKILSAQQLERGLGRKVTQKKRLMAFAGGLAVAIVGLIGLRGYFAGQYYLQVTPILAEIKNTAADSYCVAPEMAVSKGVPYLHLNQDNFLVDWAMPQTIYGKTVSFCD